MAEVFKKTASLTASTTWEFDAVDLSQTRALRFELTLTAPGGLVSDTLAIYFQTRSQSGIWQDRVAFDALLGNGGAKYLAAEMQTDVPLGATEEEGPMYGPSPCAAHLTAGYVVNGYLPPLYLGALSNAILPGPNNQPATAYRFEFVESGTATWPVTMRVDADERSIGW